MVRFTKNMNQCLARIQREVINSFDEQDIQTIIMKPTKKKEFKAIVKNIGKPTFQFFINDRFIATYFYDKELKKWKIEK